MNLRPATPADAAVLLAWRNDPVTRAMSFDTGAVGLEEHGAWLEDKLIDPRAELWIGEVDGQPIGQVRFDLQDDATALVSITVAPHARGRGHGLTLLSDAINRQDLGAAVLRAEIRHGNAPSLRIFEQAGFTIRVEEEDRLLLERRP